MANEENTQRKDKSLLVGIVREATIDIGRLTYNVGKAGLYLATAPIVGSLSHEAKARIYGENLDPVNPSRLTNIATWINTGIQLGTSFYFANGDNGFPWSIKGPAGYFLIESVLRLGNQILKTIDGEKEPLARYFSPGSLTGLIPSLLIGWGVNVYGRAKSRLENSHTKK